MNPLALLALALALHPVAPEVTVLRSRLAPLVVVPLSGADAGRARPLGPMSPRGFGRDAGRLRALAVSEPLRVVAVVVASDDGGALFTLDLDDPDAAPVRVAAVTAVDLDVALAADGRRLAYVDAGALVVAELASPGSPVRRVAVARPGERLERPRWLDARRLAFERTLTVAGSPPTSVEVATPDGDGDGDGDVRPLVPHLGRSQDRLQAALPGGAALVSVDGTLYRVDARGRTAIGERFGAHVHGDVPGGALVTLGQGGVDRRAALALVGPDGAPRELRSARRAYLDPLSSPDGARAAWSVAARDGWSVEVVAIDGAAAPARRTATAHPVPIQLVAWTSDGRHLVGCRGVDVVAIDADADADTPARVLATATNAPVCTVRAVVDAATGPVVVYDRRLGDDWAPAYVPVVGGPVVALPANASFVGAATDRVVLQTGWDRGSGAIVASLPGVGGAVTLVPWQADGIAEAHLAPDGATVVYRLGRDPAWLATRVDRPGLAVAVTGAPSATARRLGLTADRLVLLERDAERVVSYRLDGRDAGHPTTVLDQVREATEVDPRSGRVAGLALDGRVVSGRADGADAAHPTLVAAGWPAARFGRLALDPAHGRVVFAGPSDDGPRALLAAAIDGADAARPVVVARPDRELCDLAIDGSGARPLPARPSGLPFGWAALAPAPLAPPPDGEEGRERLAPGR